MPSVINLKLVNINTPQQNAGAFFGQTVFSGWDANQTYNAAHDGTFGALNVTVNSMNYVFNGHAFIDGVILDSDYKATTGGTV